MRKRRVEVLAEACIIGIKASEAGCLMRLLLFNLNVCPAYGVADSLYAVSHLLVNHYFLDYASLFIDHRLFYCFSHFDHAFFKGGLVCCTRWTVYRATLNRYTLLPQMHLLFDRFLCHRRVDTDITLHSAL